MKGLFVCVLFAIVVAISASDVVVLTGATFDSTIAAGPFLVEFYAPWCGHCKRLAPTWEELATDQKGVVGIAKVDCTVEKSLAQRFGIRGFPTIKFFKDGKVYDYSGSRTTDAFKRFASDDYKSKSSTPIPTHGAPTQKRSDELPAGEESDIVVLTDATFDQTKTGGWFIKFYAPWCGHCKKMAPTWTQLATASKGKDFKIAKVDCTVHKTSCSQYGVRGYPTLKFIKDGKTFDYKGSRDFASLQAFAQGGYSGAAAPAATAGAGAAADAGPSDVVVLGVDNFGQVKTGTWLVEFYAPWCGHCKKLAPTWESLATEVKGSFNVAKVDCTVHRALATAYEVRGFPTIKLIKDGTVYEYKGARSASAFKSFVEEGYKTAASKPIPE